MFNLTLNANLNCLQLFLLFPRGSSNWAIYAMISWRQKHIEGLIRNSCAKKKVILRSEHLSSAAVYAKRYRNRTGLSYHYTHSHLAEEERARGRGSVASRSPSVQQTDRHKRKSKWDIPQEVFKNVGMGGAARNSERSTATLQSSADLSGCQLSTTLNTFHGLKASPTNHLPLWGKGTAV